MAAMETRLKESPRRETWAGKFEFVLSCVGYCVGIGNVTRFSYLCYRNGGGAFLVPYFLTLFLGGIPMYFLEVSLGQLLSVGCLGVWKIAPAFKGVGYATVVIAFWINTFFPIMIAWAVFFFVASFTSVLPWATCGNSWNTARCLSAYDKSGLPYTCSNSSVSFEVPFSEGMNESSVLVNYTGFECKQIYNGTLYSSPVREYWERYVLQISDGIDEPGTIQWRLALCSLAVWVMCYFSIWKGIKWTGKRIIPFSFAKAVIPVANLMIVYVTATCPYILLAILLVRGVTLPGAIDGIKFFLLPDFEKLKESRVWIDAVSQVFFTIGVALSTMIALGSYSRYHYNIYRDAIGVCLLNVFTSIFSGFVVFSAIGFMAHEQQLPVSEVAASGPGLAFIAYPYAIVQLPVSPFWAVLFFLTLIILGLDSQFVTMEGFFTAVIDEFPDVLRKRRELFIAAVSAVSFLLGLSMLTNGGMYVFQIFDFYSASGISLLFAVLIECVAVSWSYGVNRYYEDLKDMLGFYPHPYWKFTWLVSTPLICMGTIVFYVTRFQPVKYRSYEFPAWAHAVGILMALSSILAVPLYMTYKAVSTRGTYRQRCRQMFRPNLTLKRTEPNASPDIKSSTEMESFMPT